MNQELDLALLAVFGLDQYDLEQAHTDAPLPKVYFNRLVRLIDTSGVMDLIDFWEAEERLSQCGRKQKVPAKAIIFAMLLNSIRATGYSIAGVARTISYRLTEEQRQELGVTGGKRLQKEWYPSVYRSARRMMKLIDPWHQSSLDHRLKGPEYEESFALYDVGRERRSYEFSAALVRASVNLLPKAYLQGYKGDVALDSTCIAVRGISNPVSKDGVPERDRTNIDYQCGWYTRTIENHDGTKTRKSTPGYELDTTVMVDAHEGGFPFPLITGIAFHRPSELSKGGPKHAIEQHAGFDPRRGLVIVDRAFNALTSTHFQEPVRMLGFETVYDYRSNQLGSQGSVPGKPIVVVDGVLYVDRMPKAYKMVTRWAIEGKKNPATGEPYTVAECREIMALREAYRMKPHGKIDADGYSRFSYPDPRKYMAFDPVTGKPTKDVPTGTTTVGLDDEVIRHLQKYPWMSEKWETVYGQRNQVETSNGTLKDDGMGGLGSTKARTARGYAYTFLCTIIGVVAENIRRIVSGIAKVILANRKPATKTRARRRRNSLDVRLQRQEKANAKKKRSPEARPPSPTE